MSENKDTVGELEEREAPVKRRGRSKSVKEPDPAELLDFEASPHLREMSTAWQRLYARIGQAVKREGL